jgi:hypothetical protein
MLKKFARFLLKISSVVSGGAGAFWAPDLYGVPKIAQLCLVMTELGGCYKRPARRVMWRKRKLSYRRV